MMSGRIYRFALPLGLMLVVVGTALARSTVLVYDRGTAEIRFAAKQLHAAMEAAGHDVTQTPLGEQTPPEVDFRIVVATRSADWNQGVADSLTPALPVKPGSEAFSIRRVEKGNTTHIFVIGTDKAGAMYGGLELEELVRIGRLDEVKTTDQAPHFKMRGPKFNIPLDVRSPSYSDASDSAQYNIETMWNIEFWKGYLDRLARHRYNYVSLWNSHPFPSMVKVPEYPDIALDDVKRSTTQWDEIYPLQATGLDSPEIIGNTQTLKEISIDEKIAFWKKVMAYARKRNIDFYIVTWNIFTNGTQGQYGITAEVDNRTTRDYFRCSVKQMFLTYPELKGIGLTTGEHFPGADIEQKEEWAFDTYGRGVLEAAREMPDRQITLWHRVHQSNLDLALQAFKPVLEQSNTTLLTSMKYARAHAMSSTVQSWHHEFTSALRKHGGVKAIWGLRNDDNYHFRWGAPDFVRQFIRNMPEDAAAGLYYGSDGYIWGREFLSKAPQFTRELEIAKHWYHWMVWGRLAYNPDVSNERFTAMLAARFPVEDADALFEAWQHASMVYPTVTGFHFGHWDFQWYIEGCISQPGPANTESGFHDVNRFITLGNHPGTDNVTIPRYVEAAIDGGILDGTTPIEVSQALHEHVDRALALVDDLDADDDRELRATLADIRTMAYMGRYYAHKIRGATALAMYRETDDGSHQQKAIEELKEAARAWKRYTDLAEQRYKNPLWLNRVGYVDWDELSQCVLEDIAIAGGQPPESLEEIQ